MIKIFDALETKFNTNGLGVINPFKCIETKKKSLGGWFVDIEVFVKYKDVIKKDNLVLVETKEKGPQPFRIGSLKIKRNIILFHAEHIVFDLQKLVLSDVRPTELSADRFLNYLKDRTDVACKFNFSSEISDLKTKYFIRKTMLDALYTTEELFNAEYDVDMLNIVLKKATGTMSNTKLVYGKNIEDVEVYEDWSNVCTKILPVGPDGITLPETYIASEIKYKNQYTSIVEFNIDRQTEDEKDKTEEQIILELRQIAKEYLNQNKYPRVNYTLKADIEQTLNVGDVVPVHHPLVTLETRVQEYEYDCNKKQVTKIVYGNFDRTVKKAFDDIKNQIILTENHLKENEKTLNVVRRTATLNSVLIQDTYRKNEIDTKEQSIIEQTQNSINTEVLRIDKQFNEVTKSYDSHFQSVDQKLTPYELTTTISEAISNDNNIHTTKFIMDKDGLHIKNGGLDISNNLGTKVLYADSDGNLTLNGKITAITGKIGCWDIKNDELSTYDKKWNDSKVIGMYIGSSGIAISDSFQVSQYGYLKASGVEITGTIKGSKISGGNIEGTIIDTTYVRIAKGNNITLINSEGLNTSYFVCSGDGQVNGFLNVGGNLSCSTLQLHKNVSDSIKAVVDYSSSSVRLEHFGTDASVQLIGHNNKYRVGVELIPTSSYPNYTAFFRPLDSGWTALGTDSKRWYRYYGSNADNITSDERLKSNIQDIQRYDVSLVNLNTTMFNYTNANLFEMIYKELKPKTYYMRQEKNDKLHIGFIAQDIVETLNKLGCSENDLDLVQHNFWTDEKNGEQKEEYGLIYNDFIALNTYMIQKCMKRIDELERKLSVQKGI